MGLVSRAWPVQTAMRNRTRDEGGPFEVVLIASHRKLLSSSLVARVGFDRPHEYDALYQCRRRGNLICSPFLFDGRGPWRPSKAYLLPDLSRVTSLDPSHNSTSRPFTH